MFRQDRKLADDLRQLAIARRIENEGHLALARLFRLGDVTVIGGKLRAVFLQRLERKNHIVGRDRLAVMPSGVRPQPVGDR